MLSSRLMTVQANILHCCAECFRGSVDTILKQFSVRFPLLIKLRRSPGIPNTSKMPLFRPNPRISLRLAQRYAYSSAQAPAINVTNVPAPHSGSIRILSLNRPAARNAISRQLLTELTHQVNSIHSEGETGSTRALILASDVDSSFCAGADLKERAGFTQEEYDHDTFFRKLD
jgi:hypothetical protein